VLVVDEDALAPVALFDRVEDPWEDENLVAAREAVPVVGEMMDRIVRPFFATPAVRPHRSPFAG
jgi:hypothetical protein